MYWLLTGDGCGFPGSHAVDSNGPNGSGFDMGRRQLREKYGETAHDRNQVLWGNTRNFLQCDGDLAGSNGYGLRLEINNGH